MILKNINDIPKFLNHQNSITYLSFDVFDTLLIRKIEPPEATKKISSYKMFQRKIFNLNTENIYELRIKCESFLRNTSKAKGFDTECSIIDVFKRMLQLTKTPISELNNLIEIELSVEGAFIAPMPKMNNLLKSLNKQHKIIAISDTYLPEHLISKLLSMAGLRQYISAIYCSCDHKFNKASGRLFEYVQKHENIPYHQWSHIGDNYISDYFRPQIYGIQTMLFYSLWSLNRRSSLTWSFPGRQNRPCKESLAINALLTIHPKHSLPPYYDWGYNIVGPVLAVFTHLLFEKLQSDGQKHLYFLARDGFLLKKLFKLFCNNLSLDKNNLFDSCNYLCLSRYTTFIASLKKIGKKECFIATIGSNITIGQALSRMGISIDSYTRRLLDSFQLSPDTVLNSKTKAETLGSIIKDRYLLKKILQNSSLQRNYLDKYLRNIGLFSKVNKVAFIDVGWNGSTQDAIAEAYGSHPDFPEIHGYYLAHMKPLTDSKNHKTGLMYDFRNPTLFGMGLTYFREAFEFSTRALHGTTVGYHSEKGHPLFKRSEVDRIHEKVINKHITEIHNGILDFSHNYIKMHNIFNLDPLICQKITLRKHYHAISFPDKRIVNALSTFTNSDDFGTNHPRGITFSKHSFSKKETKSLFHLLIETPWREALLVQSKIPFLLTLLYFAKIIVFHKRSCHLKLNSLNKKRKQLDKKQILSTIHYKIQSLIGGAKFTFKLLTNRALSYLIFYFLHMLKFFPPHWNIIFIQQIIKLKQYFLFSIFKSPR